MNMQEPQMSFAILLARICLGLVFFVSAVHKAIWFDKAIEEFAKAGVSLLRFSVSVTICLHFCASLALFTGILVTEFAAALIVFLILASFKAHDFRNQAGSERLIASRNALANLAMIGGLILLGVTGPGNFTL
jgi:putative oxidoreductase